jgi:hypothetical protein
MDLKAPTHLPVVIAAAMGATIMLGIAAPSVVDDAKKILRETTALLAAKPGPAIGSINAYNAAGPPYLNRGAPVPRHSRFFRDNKKLRLLGD